MAYLYKKKHLICYDLNELEGLFHERGRGIIFKFLKENGYLLPGFQYKESELSRVLKGVNLIHDKEDKEIFSILFVFKHFYEEEGKVCFYLRDNFDPKISVISSIDKLKLALKESDLTDFLFLHKDGFRAYQIKFYMGKLDTDNFFAFLQKKLKHYAYDLGETNLLIHLQSKDSIIPPNFFQDLHLKLKSTKIKGTGHIVVSLNEKDENHAMYTVHPFLGKTIVPIKRVAN